MNALAPVTVIAAARLYSGWVAPAIVTVWPVVKPCGAAVVTVAIVPERVIELTFTVPAVARRPSSVPVAGVGGVSVTV
ncbi:MAG TPA: hypothetical protein VN581_11845 [Patescibacteria group bacterium]|nr:hypothetical protein [Patescibacteria group bacterium]